MCAYFFVYNKTLLYEKTNKAFDDGRTGYIITYIKVYLLKQG